MYNKKQLGLKGTVFWDEFIKWRKLLWQGLIRVKYGIFVSLHILTMENPHWQTGLLK